MNEVAFAMGWSRRIKVEEEAFLHELWSKKQKMDKHIKQDRSVLSQIRQKFGSRGGISSQDKSSKFSFMSDYEDEEERKDNTQNSNSVIYVQTPGTYDNTGTEIKSQKGRKSIGNTRPRPKYIPTYTVPSPPKIGKRKNVKTREIIEKITKLNKIEGEEFGGDKQSSEEENEVPEVQNFRIEKLEAMLDMEKRRSEGLAKELNYVRSRELKEKVRLAKIKNLARKPK